MNYLFFLLCVYLQNKKNNKKKKNDEKYMKIKFNSDDELPLNKTKEIPTIAIVVRAVFHENRNIIHKVS